MRRAARPPPRGAFTPAERALVDALATPEQVQEWLHGVPYNWEPDGETLRTFRGVVQAQVAHCIEGAMSAATILEQHGFPPIILDLTSADGLDHVVYLFQRDGLFGTVAASRHPGLHGRQPAYRNLHTLVASYAAPYIGEEACLTGYAIYDLRHLPRQDWRLSSRNVWHVERALNAIPHKPFRVPRAYLERWRKRYVRFKSRHPRREPTYFPNRRRWM